MGASEKHAAAYHGSTTVADLPNYAHVRPPITLADVVFTEHALGRARDRGFTAEEIQAAIDDPERAWISRKHEAWMFKRGRLLVALREHRDNPGRWAVITLTWGDDREREDAHVFEAQLDRARRALGWKDDEA